jgi:hypothetical protein
VTEQDIRRVIRKLIYGTMAAVVAALLVGVGNVAYTNSVDHKREASRVAVEHERAALAEQNRQLVCALAIAQADAFQDATSPAGQKSRDAWLAMADRFHCS